MKTNIEHGDYVRLKSDATKIYTVSDITNAGLVDAKDRNGVREVFHLDQLEQADEDDKLAYNANSVVFEVADI